MTQDGAPDTAGQLFDTPTSRVDPSPEIQHLVERVNGAASETQGRNGETSSVEEASEPPILDRAYRVALEEGKRHVEVTPERIAELIKLSEESEGIATARSQLERTVKESAVFKAMGETLESMDPRRREALMHLVFNEPERLDQIMRAEDDEEDDEPPTAAKLAYGNRNGHQTSKPDPRLSTIERAVSMLVEREMSRDRQVQEQTLGQRVEQSMKEYSVFKASPDLAGFAKDHVMLLLGQSQNPEADVQSIVAQVANRTNQLERQRQEQKVRESMPDQSSARTIPNLRANDLRNGNVLAQAKSEYQKLFGP